MSFQRSFTSVEAGNLRCEFQQEYELKCKKEFSEMKGQFSLQYVGRIQYKILKTKGMYHMNMKHSLFVITTNTY